MNCFKSLAFGLIAVVAVPVGAGQLDIGTFINLRRGMLESEVLLRAGPPDLVTSPHGEPISEHGYGYESAVRELHYIPGPEEHDPQLTVVTVTRGRVSALERRKIIAPTRGGAPPPATGRGASRSETDIRRERAQRTLEAAEEYADVRARIKERGTAGPPEGSGTLYRSTGGAGDAYFGDVPPAAGSPPEK